MLAQFVPLVFAGFVCLAACALAWVSSSRLRPPFRTAARCLAVFGALLALPMVMAQTARGADQGRFLCSGCGLSKRLFLYMGLVLRTDPDVVGDATGSCVDEYATAFPSDPSIAHEHSWIPVGCHARGYGWALYSSTDGIWFCELPLIADLELGRKYAAKLRGAPLTERREALWTFGITRDDADDPSARFAAWRDEWRREHPDWP